jgi:hypothetical protein
MINQRPESLTNAVKSSYIMEVDLPVCATTYFKIGRQLELFEFTTMVVTYNPWGDTSYAS